MYVWTHERRKILRSLVRKGKNLQEISYELTLPDQIGKYCLSNAIKRYTSSQDRTLGAKQRQQKRLHRRQQKKTDPLTSSSPVLRNLSTLPSDNGALQEETLEIALYSSTPLPPFHPLTWDRTIKSTSLPSAFHTLRPWHSLSVDNDILKDSTLLSYLEQGSV